MVNRLRTLLIRIVVALQFWPFTFFFAAFYQLAIWVSVFFVSRIPGVITVYLSGSLARSNAIYGLSDIDFSVFVEGAKSEDTVRRIRHLFLRLRICFPMLGAAEEKGVYFLPTFAEDYERFPLVQHLFDKDFYGHRLLWGEDVLTGMELQSLSERDLLVTYLWKLRYWMEKVLFFLETERLSEIQQFHTFFKAISNVGYIYLKLAPPGSKASDRRRTLSLVRDCMGDEDAQVIDALLASRGTNYRRNDTSLEAAFLLFKKMLVRCVQMIGDKYGYCRPSVQGGALGESGLINMIQEKPNPQWLRTMRRFCGAGARIEVVMAPSVPINTLDCRDFGLPMYLVICDAPLSLEEVKGLQAFYRRRMAGAARLMIQESPGVLYALHSDMLEHWMATHIEEQHLFQSWFPAKGKKADPQVVSRLIKRIGYQISEIRSLAAGSHIRRLDSETYWSFFFSSLQRLILYQSLVSGSFRLPATAEGVCAYLRENTSLSKRFVDLLLAQDPTDPAGGPESPPVNLKKTGLLLQVFSDIVEKGESFDQLDALNVLDDQSRLKVSVVVVTRNRALQLEHCLHSIWDQRRLPDEVVVVDNGSTDATKEIVSAFTGPRAIAYVYEPTPGVSSARNTGMTAAKGDIVAFLDDDAMADKDWLFYVEQAFAKDNHIGIVGGGIHHMVENRSDIVYRYHGIQEGN